MSESELETALRNALAKGDASNPEFRQRVYRAAVDALQRTLAAKPDMDPAHAADQKRRLAEAIKAAEAAYASAPPPRAESDPGLVSDVRPDPRAGSLGPEVTGLRAEPRPERRDPRGGLSGARGEEQRIDAPGRSDRRQRRRAPFATMLVGAVALALIVMGTWWVISTGAFQSAEERDTSVPNPPVELQNESFEGTLDPGTATEPARVDMAASGEDGWMILFRPADPTTVSLDGDASATIESDAIGDFARILSPDPQSSVSVDIPPGVLQMLAGKAAQFSIVARTDENAATQISVTCDLAGLGDCGRHRFSVSQNESEFLFRVDVPEGAGSSGAGTLSIITDVEDQGRSVKLSGIRVRELSE